MVPPSICALRSASCFWLCCLSMSTYVVPSLDPLRSAVSQVWQYRLWSFQGRDTQLERFLAKRFENWSSAQLSFHLTTVDFQPKTFLIQYPSLEISTTGIAIFPGSDTKDKSFDKRGSSNKPDEFDPYARSWHGSQYGSR